MSQAPPVLAPHCLDCVSASLRGREAASVSPRRRYEGGRSRREYSGRGSNRSGYDDDAYSEEGSSVYSEQQHRKPPPHASLPHYNLPHMYNVNHHHHVPPPHAMPPFPLGAQPPAMLPLHPPHSYPPHSYASGASHSQYPPYQEGPHSYPHHGAAAFGGHQLDAVPGAHTPSIGHYHHPHPPPPAGTAGVGHNSSNSNALQDIISELKDLEQTGLCGTCRPLLNAAWLLLLGLTCAGCVAETRDRACVCVYLSMAVVPSIAICACACPCLVCVQYVQQCGQETSKDPQPRQARTALCVLDALMP
jgi:hypothetical protein